MSDLSIAFITIFGTVAFVSGVVLYVFNGTKKLMKKMDRRTAKMDERTVEMVKIAEQRHKEVIQQNQKIDERAEQRHREAIQYHQDIVELLKRGFGSLSKDAADIKEAVNK